MLSSCCVRFCEGCYDRTVALESIECRDEADEKRPKESIEEEKLSSVCS